MRFSSLYQRVFPLLSASSKPGPLIIFSDLDGTLTKPDKSDYELMLHPKALDAIAAIDGCGGMFVASSARSAGEIKAAFDGSACSVFSANDGCVICMPGISEPVVFGDCMPDFSEFEEKVGQFILGMEDVRMKDMDAYFTLMITKDHPERKNCEAFFENEVGAVSAKSGGLPVVFQTWPTTISLGPRDKRTKAGAIEYLLPKLLAMFDAGNPDNIGDPILVCAGDGHNDIDALTWVKERNGHSLFVRDGVMRGIPDFATVELKNVDEWVSALELIARNRRWHLDLKL